MKAKLNKLLIGRIVEGIGFTKDGRIEFVKLSGDVEIHIDPEHVGEHGPHIHDFNYLKSPHFRGKSDSKGKGELK